MSNAVKNVYNSIKKGSLCMEKTFSILIFKDAETGTYWATCPALKGCNTQGDTIEETKENMKEAIALYLEDNNLEAMNTPIEDTVTVEIVHA